MENQVDPENRQPSDEMPQEPGQAEPQQETAGPDTSSNESDEQALLDLDADKLFAAMSYMAVLVVVPLLTRKDDPFIRFHAKQGLVILIGFIIAFIAMYWSNVMSNLLFLVLLIASVIGLIQALQGRRWKIPGIGHIADLFEV